jgi:hypothetical protein
MRTLATAYFPTISKGICASGRMVLQPENIQQDTPIIRKIKVRFMAAQFRLRKVIKKSYLCIRQISLFQYFDF